MFLNPELRKKSLEMKKYNNLLENSFISNATIYDNRLYLQHKDYIQPLNDNDFEDIVFVEKTDKSNEVSEEVKEVPKVEKEEEVKVPTEEEVIDEDKTNEEITEEIPTLPEIPSDNKKTIFIPESILKNSKIDETLFSDNEEDDSDDTKISEKNTSEDTELFGGNKKSVIINSFF